MQQEAPRKSFDIMALYKSDYYYYYYYEEKQLIVQPTVGARSAKDKTAPVMCGNNDYKDVDLVQRMSLDWYTLTLKA